MLDDYSRYIISWKLTTTMGADDVKLTLDDGHWTNWCRSGGSQTQAQDLLSDNGPCYLSKELKEYLKERKMQHTRGAPYHPQTQGKIERYHRSMKNVVKLENYYYPWELEKAIGQFVDYYNHQRYHESLDNVTPADMFYDRYEEIMDRRQLIKQQTLRCRREENLMTCSTY